jgi:radical SAM protein with 4Fe4S-binding SPASM domain
VSVVVEADGAVRPCYFHQAIGNVRRTPLSRIVERELPAFRRALAVGDNPVCRQCVCSLKASWRNAPWRH